MVHRRVQARRPPVIVVDTNVVAGFILPGPLSGHARALFVRDPDWTAPILWRSEFRNLLAGYLRRSLLTLGDAFDVHQKAQSAITDSVAGDSGLILELVSASRCSAYDCEFVALALELEVPLVTAHLQLLDAFPRIAVSLRD